MVDWSEAGGIAAVVSALYLPFILSPTAYGALQASGRWVAWCLWPAWSYCKCLSWDDVPEGNIHECQKIPGLYSVPNGCCCQAKSLEKVFTRAFKVLNERQKLVQKPQELALNGRYVLTDVFTLLAFIISSTDQKPSGNSISIRNLGDVSIASVTCVGQIRPDMTKRTLEGIMAGYPPWYRERLVVAHGPVIPHPIKARDDVFRAGWVLSVGLSETEPLPRVVNNTHTFTDTRRYMDKPIKRVLEKMRDDIKPHFPEHATVKAAISAVEYLVRISSGSGVEKYLTLELHTQGNSVYTSELSGSDCIFAMSLFNKVGELSDADQAKLSPILTPVIDAAFRGSYRVVQHCKNGLAEFQIPPDMQNFRRQVYVDLGQDY